MTLSLVNACLAQAQEWNESKSWLRSKLLSRTVTLIVIPMEAVAIVTTTARLILADCVVKSWLKIGIGFSGSKKLRQWDSQLNPSQTVKHIVALVAGTFFSTLFSWSMPRWNCAIHSRMGLGKKKNNLPMAKMIHEVDSLDKGQMINGIAVTEIEKRAAPVSEQGTVPGAHRLLGKKERLRAVLQEDWERVKKLGETHTFIAEKLKTVCFLLDCAVAETKIQSLMKKVKRYQETIKKEQNSHRRQFLRGKLQGSKAELQKWRNGLEETQKILEGKPISFTVLEGNKEAMSKEIESVQKACPGLPVLLVSQSFESATGTNIFTDKSAPHDWGLLTIKNARTKESISFPNFLLDYIENFGFYGGKEDGSCRVDPEKLLRILTA